MLLLLLHKPSKQSEQSGLRPDTSSLVNFILEKLNKTKFFRMPEKQLLRNLVN